MGNTSSKNPRKFIRQTINAAHVEYKKGNVKKAAVLFYQGGKKCKENILHLYKQILKKEYEYDGEGRKKILEDLHSQCEIFNLSNFGNEMKKLYMYS
jgi:hypothetical protein